MGILPSFAGVAVHDAWAPYDTYTTPDHQLCCAHALRELQAVTDAAPKGQWCWATQAAEALTAMQALAAEAISHDRDTMEPAALAAQIHLYRSAALAGASQTALRLHDQADHRRHPSPRAPAYRRRAPLRHVAGQRAERG